MNKIEEKNKELFLEIQAKISEYNKKHDSNFIKEASCLRYRLICAISSYYESVGTYFSKKITEIELARLDEVVKDYRINIIYKEYAQALNERDETADQLYNELSVIIDNKE